MTRTRSFIVAVACFAAATFIVASWAHAALDGGYRYDGRNVCAAATVTLNAATVYPGRVSHVAVWDGVTSKDASLWVQAGVASYGGASFIYIERQGRSGYTLRRVGAGDTVHVSLTMTGSVWTVRAAGVAVSVRIPQATCFVGAESEDWSRLNRAVGSVEVGGSRFDVKLS